jgi:hypothetical protein
MDAMTIATIIGTVLAAGAVVGGVIFWAGSMGSKLDSITSILTEIKASLVVQGQEIQLMDRRLTQLEDKIIEIEKKLEERKNNDS